VPVRSFCAYMSLQMRGRVPHTSPGCGTEVRPAAARQTVAAGQSHTDEQSAKNRAGAKTAPALFLAAGSICSTPTLAPPHARRFSPDASRPI
jgi:hypothetical protein